LFRDCHAGADRRSALADVSRRTQSIVLAGIACCAVLTATGCWTLSINHRQAAAKPVLPPLVKPKDALTLEVYYISRPAGDPLLSDALWRQLDENAVQSPEIRARLRSAGLRVGLAGSNAPQTLRAAEQQSTSESAGAGARRIPLLAGQETSLEAAIIPEAFSLRTMGAAGEAVRPYEGARCILRISGEREQEGWVRLHFQPELHHGPVTIQPKAGDGDWKFQQGQKVDRLYEQCFDVELNIGELLVVGAARDAEEDLIGARFFRSGTPPSASERVMVIRVADIQQIEPVRSEMEGGGKGSGSEVEVGSEVEAGGTPRPGIRGGPDDLRVCRLEGRPTSPSCHITSSSQRATPFQRSARCGDCCQESAAVMVRSMSAGVWHVETKFASNWLHGRYTLRSSIS
jgi:hypothetical protein